jgi:hypothetical protein
MTIFIDLRALSVGGPVADAASTWDDGHRPVSPAEFTRRVQGRNLLLATHGFNVDRADGLASLGLWSQGCQWPGATLFIGVLWPGDSRFVPVFDYVYEGVEAIASGKLLADYLNLHAGSAQSLSLCSHSLGARTMLEAARHLNRAPRRLLLMAGAIENDCLVREYADAVQAIPAIHVLASRADAVLEWAFPAANLIGEIIMHGHPYAGEALGRDGPQQPLPAGLPVQPWQIPDGDIQSWNYGHGSYLPKGVIGAPFELPVSVPGPDTPPARPDNDNDNHNGSDNGWRPAWSAAVQGTVLGWFTP